jgi:hypothetical protein
MMTIVTKTTASSEESVHRTQGLLLVAFVTGLFATVSVTMGRLLSNTV